MLEKAISLAVVSHYDQKRKDGSPYILHPLRVMFAVEQKLQGKPDFLATVEGAATWTSAEYHREIAMAAAVLHDTCEDCGLAPGEIATQIHRDVAELVDLLTRRDGEVYAEYICRTSRTELSRLIKIADLEDNLSDIDNLPKADEAKYLRRRYEWALSVLK